MLIAMKIEGMFATTSSLLLVAVMFLLPSLHPTVAQVGVCYGGSGDTIPSAQVTINLLKSNNIGTMRIYEPNLDILRAVQGSGITLIIGDHNDKVQGWANNPSIATQWVQNNVVPFASSIKYVVVGNEVSMSDMQTAPFVGPAMQNVLNALNAANLGGQIKVTTAIKTDLLRVSWPPSQGAFGNPGFMNPVLKFLRDNGSPLLANVYTYFGYRDGTTNNLDYALSNDNYEFTDPGNNLRYTSLFDAQVDALHHAIALGVGSNLANNVMIKNVLANDGTLTLLVSESGWSSNGGHGASRLNAQTYYKNMIRRTKQGTPLQPRPMGIYLFAMYDENQKPGSPDEQNFGLFTPNDQRPKYDLQFN